MEIKTLKISIIVIFLLSLLSCDKNCSFDIASDQIRFADSIEVDAKTYYLYTRTSGWHEKVVFFELYDKEPTFDKCTYRPNVNGLYGIHYDYFPDDPDSEEKYIKKMILQPDQPEKLKIIYTKDKNKGVANIYDVKFAR